jgi:hypothetical protein
MTRAKTVSAANAVPAYSQRLELSAAVEIRESFEERVVVDASVSPLQST